MRTKSARDHNEPEIVDALRKAGYKVTLLSDSGVPDLLVIRRGSDVPCEVVLTSEGAISACEGNAITLLEVKQKTGRLTKAQREWWKEALNA